MLSATLILLAAIQVRDQRLTAPSAALDHDFSRISGVRELPDGRVLVSDWIEETVNVVDLARKSVRQIGRRGAGPGEYRLPGALLPMPGDSTLLVDQGNERLVVIGPDLRIARAFSSHRPGMAHGITPRAIDGRGRIYFEIPAWADPAGSRDSVSVARLDLRDGTVERLIRVRGITYREGSVRGIPYVVFAPRDGWQAAPGGRVAVVRPEPYAVEWREASGSVVRGKPLARAPLPVTARDHIAYVAQFMATAAVAGRGESGMAAMPASEKTPEAISRLVALQEIRTVKPPFTDRTPLIASDGTLWVERSVANGAQPVWDRFDARGAYIGGVVLPPSRRLLALGSRGAYTAFVDPDGLERLERYTLPSR